MALNQAGSRVVTSTLEENVKRTVKRTLEENAGAWTLEENAGVWNKKVYRQPPAACVLSVTNRKRLVKKCLNREPRQSPKTQGEISIPQVTAGNIIIDQRYHIFLVCHFVDPPTILFPVSTARPPPLHLPQLISAGAPTCRVAMRMVRLALRLSAESTAEIRNTRSSSTEKVTTTCGTPARVGAIPPSSKAPSS